MINLKAFKMRLIAIYRIISSRNFILIDGISKFNDEEDKKIHRSRLLRRTDYNTEDEFLTLKQVIMSNFDVKSIEKK